MSKTVAKNKNNATKQGQSSDKNGNNTGYKVGRGNPPLEHRFSSDNQPENRRKKETKTLLKQFSRDVSDDERVRIASVMLAALSCKSSKDALARLKEAEEKEPDYGFIFQQTIRDVKKRGLPAIMDVLEWLFGKTTNLNVSGGLGVEMKPLVDLTKRKKNGGER